MPERLMNCHLRAWGLLLYLLACSFVSVSVFAQSNQNPALPSDHPPQRENKITLKGCLGGGSDRFNFATTVAELPFILTGHISGLEKYLDREMILEGHEGDSISVEGFFKPFPSFEVDRIVEVVEKRVPILSPSFSNSTAWHTETNKVYGVRFAHPDTMLAATVPDPNQLPNFVTEKDAETVSSFSIPGEAYSGANLRGGSFTIFVNRHISNQASCNQFGSSGPQEVPPSPFVVGKLRYMDMQGGGGGMGTWYGDRYFHTFQNGLCYELAFQLVTYNAHNADTGCNIPLLDEEDELKLIKPLLASVSFFPPSVLPVREGNPQSVPSVTEFAASSQTANVANRGLITFSWSTQDADYVEFTYTCPNPLDAEQRGVSSVVISENGPNRYCKNTESIKTFSSGHFYHSPDSSAQIGFGYFNHDDPTSVVVTITPFSRGTAYPGSSKSLTISVNPYSPFQRGVPIVRGKPCR
jgi:hypothetical protein